MLVLGAALTALAACAGAIGYALGRRRSRGRSGVPSDTDVNAAFELAKEQHRDHAQNHPIKYPGHLTQRALIERIRQELLARGFTHMPIDLGSRVKV